MFLEKKQKLGNFIAEAKIKKVVNKLAHRLELILHATMERDRRKKAIPKEIVCE